MSENTIIYEKCADCIHYKLGKQLYYPNTPENRQIWRDCRMHSRIKADTMACTFFSTGETKLVSRESKPRLVKRA